MGLAVFLVGLVWSGHELWQRQLQPAFGYLIPLALLAAPAGLHLSVRRFQSVAALYRIDYAYLNALGIVTYGSLANILPLPGAFILRVTALRRHVGLRKSLFVNILSVLLWLATALLVLSFLLLIENHRLAFQITGSSGVLLLLACCAAALRIRLSCRAWLELLFVQLVLSILNVLRLWLICLALGFFVSPILPAAISVGSILATGTGVSPGGAGIAETVSAVIAGYMRHGPELGFAMTALNRILTWSVLLLALLWMAKRRTEVLEITRPDVAREDSSDQGSA